MFHPSDPRASGDVFEAVWSAEYHRALATLYGATTLGASVMRARIYQRMELFDRVFDEFHCADFEQLQPREAAEVASLAGLSYARLGRAVESDRAATRAQDFARLARDPLLDAQLRHEQGYVDLYCGRAAESEAKACEAFELIESCAMSDTPLAYALEVNHVRARILDHRRLHAAQRGTPEEEARLITEAVLCVNLVRHHDLWIESSMLASLTATVYHYDSVIARELLRTRAAAIRWTHHIESRRVHIDGALRANDLLFKSFRRVGLPGSPPSPTLASRVSRFVTELLFAHWDDREAYERELRFAIEIAQLADWSASTGEEFLALGKLSAIVASQRPQLALEFRNAYRARVAAAPRGVTALAPRVRDGDDAFMEGCIAKAVGDEPGAVAALTSALGTFNGLALGHQAAIAGIELFALSRNAAALEPAERFAQRYPDAPFARRVRASLARARGAQPARFPYFELF